MSLSPKDSNGEIFLANSQGWKEEAEAVIKDVKDQVKEIVISNKLEVSSFLDGTQCGNLRYMYAVTLNLREISFL